MPTGQAQTLWYLAPGLAHQLGNALFTLQGRARLLAVAEPERIDEDRRAILDGVERAHAGLDVLRWLLDEARQPVAIADLLRSMVEVARLPLRDRGIALELDEQGLDGGPATLAVEPGSTCQLLTATFRALSGSLPGTPHARLRLSCATEGTAARIELRLAALADGAPLARDSAHAREGIQRELELAGAHVENGAEEGTLILSVPATRGTLRAP